MRRFLLALLPVALVSGVASGDQGPAVAPLKLRLTPLIVKRIEYSIRQAKLGGAPARVGLRLAREALLLAEGPGGTSEVSLPDDYTTILRASRGGKTVELTLKTMEYERQKYRGISGGITRERKSASGDIRRFERTFYQYPNDRLHSAATYERLVEEDEGEFTVLMPATRNSKYLE